MTDVETVEDGFVLVRKIRACKGEAAGVALLAAAMSGAVRAERKCIFENFAARNDTDFVRWIERRLNER